MSVSLYYIFNIRSITKTEGKLEELLMHFPCTSTITALSETNFNLNKLNKINIDGFKLVFNNEFLTPGEVGLYIDKNISFTIQDNLLFQDDFTIQYFFYYSNVCETSIVDIVTCKFQGSLYVDKFA